MNKIVSEKERRLLHVDDDPQMLKIVSTKLEAWGYEVISTTKPESAIDTLLEHNCRVVLLDIDMPRVNGLDLLQRIKQFDGGVLAVMLTGMVSNGTVLESMRLGAEACLFKPIEDWDRLKTALDAAFDKNHFWWETLQDLVGRRRQTSTAT